MKEGVLNLINGGVTGIWPESLLLDTLKNLRLVWFKGGIDPVKLLSSK